MFVKWEFQGWLSSSNAQHVVPVFQTFFRFKDDSSSTPCTISKLRNCFKQCNNDASVVSIMRRQFYWNIANIVKKVLSKKSPTNTGVSLQDKTCFREKSCQESERIPEISAAKGSKAKKFCYLFKFSLSSLSDILINPFIIISLIRCSFIICFLIIWDA